MNYQEVINDKRKKLIAENTRDLIENFSKYKDKVMLLQSRNPDLDFSDIEDRIKNKDPFAISLLRKDTSRQNLTENCFFEYTGLKKAPAGGKNAIRFNGSKSADFVINSYYGTQKYIQDSGGAQDNQINDAIYFATEASKLGKKTIICIDGDYGKKAIKNKKIPNGCIVVSADELKAGIESGRFI